MPLENGSGSATTPPRICKSPPAARSHGGCTLARARERTIPPLVLIHNSSNGTPPRLRKSASHANAILPKPKPKKYCLPSAALRVSPSRFSTASTSHGSTNRYLTPSSNSDGRCLSGSWAKSTGSITLSFSIISSRWIASTSECSVPLEMSHSMASDLLNSTTMEHSPPSTSRSVLNSTPESLWIIDRKMVSPELSVIPTGDERVISIERSETSIDAFDCAT
mmetsp:Transcript_4478/g.9430  ORF Transcript_4478/g.9430 Transcript_4478/m.9430 type:complete len:222 (-) Transcript_4478:560-1225(-)